MKLLNKVVYVALAYAIVGSQGLEAGFFRRIGHAIAPKLILSNTARKQANLAAAHQNLAAAQGALRTAQSANHSASIIAQHQAAVAKQQAAVAHHTNILANHYTDKIMQHAHQYAKTDVTKDLDKKNGHLSNVLDFSNKLAKLTSEHAAMIQQSNSPTQKSDLFALRNQQNERLKTLRILKKDGPFADIAERHEGIRNDIHDAALKESE